MSRFSHENCDHVKTKVARAKCRKIRAAFAEVAAETIAPQKMDAPDTTTDITRETWRDFRDRDDVSVILTDGTVHENVSIHGWSAKNVQIKPAGSKFVFLPVDTVQRVLVED